MIGQQVYVGGSIRERIRLAALHSYDVLDTGSEDAFDQFVRDAARFFSVPISLISLIDADRQWFKARHGLDISETARRIAFCTYTIESENPMVVLDARKDARFADNPLVTGAPFIRFYAGVPLHTPLGRRIGSFNVISPRPRDHVSSHELAWLTDRAREIMDILEDRRARRVRARALSGAM